MMISVSVNEVEAKDLIRQRISDLVREVDGELVFWDTNELKRRTCMCINSIKDAFFYDPRFPKRKIGSKYYFPAKETRAFLEQWLMEQGVD